MPGKIKIEFAENKQDRSKKTLENILEAANHLLEQADPGLFTSRVLATRSGYSLGTLNKRLLAVDNVFLWLIEQGQKAHVASASNMILEFDPHATLPLLIEKLVDHFFSIMQKINPKIVRYYEHRMALKLGFIDDYDRIDALITPFQEAARHNRTNTFRALNETELRLILRASLSLVERPFNSLDPIAGTMEHRKIVVENCVRMLGR